MIPPPPPLGTFPEIHPFWRCGASLKVRCKINKKKVNIVHFCHTNPPSPFKTKTMYVFSRSEYLQLVPHCPNSCNSMFIFLFCTLPYKVNTEGLSINNSRRWPEWSESEPGECTEVQRELGRAPLFPRTRFRPQSYSPAGTCLHPAFLPVQF